MPLHCPRGTFRARLTLGIAVLCAGVLAAASLAIYLGVRGTLWTNLDRALLGIARTEIASAIDDPLRGPHIHEVAPTALQLPFGSGYEKIAQIKDSHGHIVAQTSNLLNGPRLETDARRELKALSGHASFANLRRGSQEYRALYHPLTMSSQRMSVLIAIPTRQIRSSLNALYMVLVVCLAAGGLASAWAACHLARRLTRPLEQIAEASRTIGEQSLGTRIPALSPDVELQHVADGLNEMLSRLESAFATQRRLIADASHELRSPLSNLRGTIEVTLRRTRTAEEYRDTLAVSLGEIGRLCRLVDGLLTLSRADAGQLTVDLQPCNLARIAESALIASRARATEKAVALKLESVEPALVNGDPDRLRQVVDNLLDNAVRFAPCGSVVKIILESSDREISLSVQDEGAGVRPEEAARLFEPFYRSDTSRCRDSGGSGLGLAIAKAIVDAHGGKISARSTPGEGSRFTFTIPALDHDPAADHELSASPEATAGLLNASTLHREFH